MEATRLCFMIILGVRTATTDPGLTDAYTPRLSLPENKGSNLHFPTAPPPPASQETAPRNPPSLKHDAIEELPRANSAPTRQKRYLDLIAGNLIKRVQGGTTRRLPNLDFYNMHGVLVRPIFDYTPSSADDLADDQEYLRSRDKDNIDLGVPVFSDTTSMVSSDEEPDTVLYSPNEIYAFYNKNVDPDDSSLPSPGNPLRYDQFLALKDQTDFNSHLGQPHINEGVKNDQATAYIDQVRMYPDSFADSLVKRAYSSTASYPHDFLRKYSYRIFPGGFFGSYNIKKHRHDGWRTKREQHAELEPNFDAVVSPALRRGSMDLKQKALMPSVSSILGKRSADQRPSADRREAGNHISADTARVKWKRSPAAIKSSESPISEPEKSQTESYRLKAVNVGLAVNASRKGAENRAETEQNDVTLADRFYITPVRASTRQGEKRYLDGIASSLIKKDDGKKRYLDGITSSLFKKDDGEKRYLDGIASSLIKKSDGEKRYLDGIASSLIKKNDGEKRYLDGIASSLIKKNDGEKRYLDGIASSLIKKNDGEKRYLDGIASSLMKKNEDEKRYLDGIATSFFKTDNVEKRHLDGIVNSLMKKTEDEKRHLDEIVYSLLKKKYGENRYLDGKPSSLIHKNEDEKRHLDSITSNLFKKNGGEKTYLDGIASSLMKRGKFQKRYLDGIASSLIKRLGFDKRYLDGIASSLIKRDTSVERNVDFSKRYLDGIVSSLIKKNIFSKRYLDGITSSLIKRTNKQTRHPDNTPGSSIKPEKTDDFPNQFTKEVFGLYPPNYQSIESRFLQVDPMFHMPGDVTVLDSSRENTVELGNYFDVPRLDPSKNTHTDIVFYDNKGDAGSEENRYFKGMKETSGNTQMNRGSHIFDQQLTANKRVLEIPDDSVDTP